MLCEYAAAKQQAYYVNLATLLAHQARPVDQRTIDYKRGYWHGVKVILGHPTAVLNDLTAELEGEDD